MPRTKALRGRSRKRLSLPAPTPLRLPYEPRKRSWIVTLTCQKLNLRRRRNFRMVICGPSHKTNTFGQPWMAMDYPTCLSNGWPIASGVIEGACRHFVTPSCVRCREDRCELSGMRWTQTGAESLLRLRAIAQNGDWDAYHIYRKAQRHLRLYGKPWSAPKTIVSQKIGLPTSTVEVTAICEPQIYAGLPLAL